MKTTHCPGKLGKFFPSLLMVFTTPLFAAAPNDNWDDRFGVQGVNDTVFALTSLGPDVYAGGTSTQAGGSNKAGCFCVFLR